MATDHSALQAEAFALLDDDSDSESSKILETSFSPSAKLHKPGTRPYTLFTAKEKLRHFQSQSLISKKPLASAGSATGVTHKSAKVQQPSDLNMAAIQTKEIIDLTSDTEEPTNAPLPSKPDFAGGVKRDVEAQSKANAAKVHQQTKTSQADGFKVKRDSDSISIGSSNSSSNQMCFICKKPDVSTNNPLVRCSCSRRYHAACHNPFIPHDRSPFWRCSLCIARSRTDQPQRKNSPLHPPKRQRTSISSIDVRIPTIWEQAFALQTRSSPLDSQMKNSTTGPWVPALSQDAALKSTNPVYSSTDGSLWRTALDKRTATWAGSRDGSNTIEKKTGGEEAHIQGSALTMVANSDSRQEPGSTGDATIDATVDGDNLHATDSMDAEHSGVQEADLAPEIVNQPAASIIARSLQDVAHDKLDDSALEKHTGPAKYVFNQSPANEAAEPVSVASPALGPAEAVSVASSAMDLEEDTPHASPAIGPAVAASLASSAMDLEEEQNRPASPEIASASINVQAAQQQPPTTEILALPQLPDQRAPDIAMEKSLPATNEVEVPETNVVQLSTRDSTIDSTNSSIKSIENQICKQCDTTDATIQRTDPEGSNSLCDACDLKGKHVEPDDALPPSAEDLPPQSLDVQEADAVSHDIANEPVTRPSDLPDFSPSEDSPALSVVSSGLGRKNLDDSLQKEDEVANTQIDQSIDTRRKDVIANGDVWFYGEPQNHQEQPVYQTAEVSLLRRRLLSSLGLLSEATKSQGSKPREKSEPSVGTLFTAPSAQYCSAFGLAEGVLIGMVGGKLVHKVP